SEPLCLSSPRSWLCGALLHLLNILYLLHLLIPPSSPRPHSSANPLRPRHIQLMLNQFLRLLQKFHRVRHPPVYFKRRLILPPRMHIKQSPIPHPTVPMNLQTPRLLPRRLHHHPQRLRKFLLFPRPHPKPPKNKKFHLSSFFVRAEALLRPFFLLPRIFR